MSSIFEKQFEVGWRNVDPNGHLANTDYLSFAVDTRIAYFTSRGFPPIDFQKYSFGPVIKTDTTDYFRELMLLEKVKVTMENGGLAPDGSRFRVVNNFYKMDGTCAARVASLGGWLSFKERKLIVPPEIIFNALESLTKTEDFAELRSSIKK
jgi:acyl-CoA thioester hydrolase